MTTSTNHVLQKAK